jgi:hypothetical protein
MLDARKNRTEVYTTRAIEGWEVFITNMRLLNDKGKYKHSKQFLSRR